MRDAAAAVEAAVDAAEDIVFSRLDRSAVEDFDVRVTIEASELDVDVYVLAPTVDDAVVTEAVDDAALAARGAADRVLREEEQ